MVDDAHLGRILDRVQEWTRAADTKAEILALMQTAAAAALASSISEWCAPSAHLWLKLGMIASIGLWLVSLVMTAYSILAVTDNPHQQSVTFFGDIPKWKPLNEYRKAVDSIAPVTLRNDYIDQIYICSIICGNKHWYLKRGIWLFVGSLVVMEITLVLNPLLS